jgi:hypothetical protein
VGVADSEIIGDYCASWDQWSAREPDYQASVAEILQHHGATIEKAFSSLLSLPIEAILRDAGLSDGDVDRLRARLT